MNPVEKTYGAGTLDGRMIGEGIDQSSRGRTVWKGYQSILGTVEQVSEAQSKYMKFDERHYYCREVDQEYISIDLGK